MNQASLHPAKSYENSAWPSLGLNNSYFDFELGVLAMFSLSSEICVYLVRGG